MVRTLKVFPAIMRAAAGGSYTLATDLADYLARKGMPFRQAHNVVAKLVKHADSKKVGLNGLSLKDYRLFSGLFDKDVFDISLESSVKARAVLGGTAPIQVKSAIKRSKAIMKENNRARN
jgi:argininosuccinate lyase